MSLIKLPLSLQREMIANGIWEPPGRPPIPIPVPSPQQHRLEGSQAPRALVLGCDKPPCCWPPVRGYIMVNDPKMALLGRRRVAASWRAHLLSSNARIEKRRDDIDGISSWQDQAGCRRPPRPLPWPCQMLPGAF
jgi:hypothetical protein